MSADGTPRSLTPREYLAILDREAGRATARVARASSSSGWDFDGIAADETSQTVTVNPYNSVLPSGGQFAMSSRTTASANGSPDPNRGAVQFSHVTHSGSYKVMVGGVEIYSGTLSAGGGSIPAGGGSNTTNWPTVDVGTYCTIDAAMTMSHAAYYPISERSAGRPDDTGSDSTTSQDSAWRGCGPTEASVRRRRQHCVGR